MKEEIKPITMKEEIKPITLEKLREDIIRRPELKNCPDMGNPLREDNPRNIIKIFLPVARDAEYDEATGTNIHGYSNDPKKGEDGNWEGNIFCMLYPEMFPQIKATDEKPTLVRMTLEIIE